jgi:hypothetical protein
LYYLNYVNKLGKYPRHNNNIHTQENHQKYHGPKRGISLPKNSEINPGIAPIQS